MINPSEISEVLKQQLENVNSKVSFEEVGTVLEVGDGVAHVFGLDNVCANELVEFENGVKGVALNLEESNVGVILLNDVLVSFIQAYVFTMLSTIFISLAQEEPHHGDEHK